MQTKLKHKNLSQENIQANEYMNNLFEWNQDKITLTILLIHYYKIEKLYFYIKY